MCYYADRQVVSPRPLMVRGLQFLSTTCVHLVQVAELIRHKVDAFKEVLHSPVSFLYLAIFISARLMFVASVMTKFTYSNLSLWLLTRGFCAAADAGAAGSTQQGSAV